MSRNLIPKSSYPELSAIWHNNKTGIILVTTDKVEYYISGFEYNPYILDVISVQTYNDDKTNVIRHENGAPKTIYVQLNDEIYGEIM